MTETTVEAISLEKCSGVPLKFEEAALEALQEAFPAEQNVSRILSVISRALKRVLKDKHDFYVTGASDDGSQKATLNCGNNTYTKEGKRPGSCLGLVVSQIKVVESGEAFPRKDFDTELSTLPLSVVSTQFLTGPRSLGERVVVRVFKGDLFPRKIPRQVFVEFTVSDEARCRFAEQ